MANPLIIAGTGHRPDKLGGYDDNVFERLKKLITKYLTSDMVVISGMALGFDQALASAALNKGCELWCYIPCREFEMRWPEQSQVRYRNLLGYATKKVYVYAQSYPGPWCLQKRNERMVDDCHAMLALWNGSKGGTFNCLEYAKTKDRTVTNLWEAFDAST